MSISREDFNKGFADGDAQLLQFLEKNQDRAFRVYEIIQNMEIEKPGDDFYSQALMAMDLNASYTNMLNALIGKKWVRREYINGAYWYIYHNKAAQE